MQQHDAVRVAAERTPEAPALEAPALEAGPTSWSYRRLDAEIERAAERLRDLGAGPGRVVALLVEPTVEGVVALHATIRTGALLAPLATTSTEVERAEAFAALNPSVVVTEGEWRASDPVVGGSRSPGPGSLGPGSLGPGSPGPGSSELGPSAQLDAQAVLWTSGSEGRPRGILISASALAASAAATGERLELRPSDRWLASLSLAHVGGLALVTRAAHLGCCLVLPGSRGSEELATALRDATITHASLVPTMLLRLVEAWGDAPVPASLRCLLVGGAHLPEPLLRRALRLGLPLALTYGLTEATSQVATAPPELVRATPGTVGHPLAGVQVRIDERGEILVKGRTLAVGSWGAADPLTDPDGWLHTGDMGELDDDGRLWVRGRLSDRIVSGGVTVEPQEVERHLLEHPLVQEVAVAGVPDPEWGERLAALVVLDAGPGRDGLWAELDQFVRDRLSPAKRPRRWLRVDALPRNANGKVDRNRVRELLSGPPSP